MNRMAPTDSSPEVPFIIGARQELPVNAYRCNDDAPFVGEDINVGKGGRSQKERPSQLLGDPGGHPPPATLSPAALTALETGSSYDAFGFCASSTIPPRPSTAKPPISCPAPCEQPATLALARRYPSEGQFQQTSGVQGYRAPLDSGMVGPERSLMCDRNLEDYLERVEYNDKIFLRARDAQASGVSQEIKADWTASDRNMPETVPARSAHCQYQGCRRTPRYGARNGPAIRCQGHKRTGMYTTRNGKLLMASRDGKAFMTATSSPASRPPISCLPVSDKAAKDTGRPKIAAQLATCGSQPTAGEPEGVHARFPQARETPPTLPTQLGSLYQKLGQTPSSLFLPRFDPFGTKHQQKGKVGLKTCLFPRCLARPHYGFSLGRPVYCVKHMRKGMVHLLKESMVLKKEKIDRRSTLSRTRNAEIKAKAAAERGAMAREGKAGQREGNERRKETEIEGGVEIKGGGKRPAPGRTSKSTRNGAVASIATPSPSSASSDSPCWSVSFLQSMRSASPPPGEACAQGLRSPRCVSKSGMAPSVESRLPQKTRKSARAGGDVSKSNRCIRAPSRKLLEASDILEHDSAQRMTKEIKEKNTKRLGGLREHQNKLRTAGLKKGEIIEELDVLPALNSAATGRAGDDAVLGGDDGEVGHEHDAGGFLSPRSNWRKPKTMEILKRTREELAEEGEASTRRAAKSFSSTSGSAKASVQKFPSAFADTLPGSKETSASADHDETKSFKRIKSTGDDEGGHKGGTNQVGGADGKGGRTGANGKAPSQTKCVRGACSKTAKFGVNDVVRYCEVHRIFGMRKIVDVSIYEDQPL